MKCIQTLLISGTALLFAACGSVSTPEELCGNGVLDTDEACDLGEQNGQAGACCSAECTFVPATTVCRAGSGDDCDPDETCTGDSAECPADVLADAAQICRVAASECDIDEACTGQPGQACPADEYVADGTACAGNGEGECSGPDTCQAGVCDSADLAAGTPCGDGAGEPTCNPDACDGAGACVDNAPVADGGACADNGGDTCCAAACVPGAPVPGSCDPCALPDPGVLNVTIIESTSQVAGQDMDARWLAVANGLGHNATIRPQTFLDDIGNLANTDVLIVASGTIALPAGRSATIASFVQSGRGVYLQSEYQTTYSTNITYAALVNNSGGSFSWVGTVTGALEPVNVLGCMSTHPELVSPLPYYWYGATGNTTAEVVLEKDGQGLGWAHCASTGALVVSSTDQDWVRPANANPTSEVLLRNILTRLAFSCN